MLGTLDSQFLSYFEVFLTQTFFVTLLSVFFFAASFILNSPTRRWWSELMSAPLFTLMSRSTLLHFLVIVMWSIWFSVSKSGDIHVALCVGLCGKRVPLIISSLRVQKSANRRRFSFICPRPSFLIVPVADYSSLGVPVGFHPRDSYAPFQDSLLCSD